MGADVSAVESFAVDNKGVEMVLIRHGMYLPVKYASLVLGIDLTPRQTWERIRGEIVIDAGGSAVP